jgi:hypothetical protein
VTFVISERRAARVLASKKNGVQSYCIGEACSKVPHMRGMTLGLKSEIT